MKIVALLSRYKADPTITNNNYVTPLQIAKEKNYEDIIELLSPETQHEIEENVHTYQGRSNNDVVDAILNDDSMFDDDAFPGQAILIHSVQLNNFNMTLLSIYHRFK